MYLRATSTTLPRRSNEAWSSQLSRLLFTLAATGHDTTSTRKISLSLPNRFCWFTGQGHGLGATILETEREVERAPIGCCIATATHSFNATVPLRKLSHLPRLELRLVDPALSPPRVAAVREASQAPLSPRRPPPPDFRAPSPT